VILPFVFLVPIKSFSSHFLIFILCNFINSLLLVQRLEFLGDSVLDYLITLHFYNEYPGLSPGLLTDMRSASVNNECYARSAVKVGLHEHILRASQALDRHIVETVSNFEKLSSESTFGWESESTFPKVSL
jgi:endoribonuclease Dicer